MVCTSHSLQSEPAKESGDDRVYSVPIDVLQTISKDFNHLQSEFEKSNENCTGSTESQGKRAEDWLSTGDPLKKNVAEGRKTLRIKSIRTIKTNPSGQTPFMHQLEDEPPPGTVARVEIKTDRARNKTIFTILPAIGGWLKGSTIGEPHSFTVNTCNLAKATKLIKPLHLERLPILRDILETSVKRADVPFAKTENNKLLEKNGKLEKIVNPLIDPASFEIPNPSSITRGPNLQGHSPLSSSSSSEQSVPQSISQNKIHSNETVCSSRATGVPHVKKVEEDDFLRELQKHGLQYEKIGRVENQHKTNNEKSTDKMNWVCPEDGCERIFPKLSKLKIHIFSHRNVRPYKCEEPGCSWAFHTAFKLKRHQGTAHADKGKKVKYECKLEKCVEKVKSFSSPYNLNQHLKRHARPLSYKCPAPGCEAAFQTSMELKSHLKSSIHRSLILQNLENGSGSLESEERLIMLPEHICHSCGKKFFNSKDLLRHINQFHSEDIDMSSAIGTVKNKYKCTFNSCDKVFELPSRLAAHTRSHTGERPYPCSWPSCRWSFRTASKLRRHERTHKNERKYTCPTCSKSYFRTEHLKSHMLAIHNPSGTPERFVCPLERCAKKFSARSTLYVHMKRHAGEEQPGQLFTSLLRCVIESCDERFYDRNELRNHVSLHHVQELAESAAGISSNHQMHASSLTVDRNNLAEESNDQEDVTAAAELDFIALLSSVGDGDGIEDNLQRVDEMKTSKDVDKCNSHIVISDNSSFIDDIKISIKCDKDSINIPDPTGGHENDVNMGTQIKITEDQIISEMIIETLTSASEESAGDGTEEVKDHTCNDKQGAENLQFATFSHMMYKNEHQTKKEATELPSVLISPFPENIIQERQQVELVTVDASAITPVKLIAKNGLSPTSPQIIHDSQAQSIPLLPHMKGDVCIKPRAQINPQYNIQFQAAANMQVNEKSINNAFGSSISAIGRISSLEPFTSNRDCNAVTRVISKGKRKAKPTSVLKCKQPKSEFLKPEIKNIYNRELIKPNTAEVINSLHMCTKVSPERKRPSILRRHNSTASTIPISYPLDISRDHQCNDTLANNPLELKCPTEGGAQKKRSPKKQKLLNNTLEYNNEYI